MCHFGYSRISEKIRVGGYTSYGYIRMLMIPQNCATKQIICSFGEVVCFLAYFGERYEQHYRLETDKPKTGNKTGHKLLEALRTQTGNRLDTNYSKLTGYKLKTNKSLVSGV